jgi:hypothetical protein
MQKAERSLRFMVEKWLVMVPAMSVRITRGNPAGSNQGRYVRLETSLSTGAFAIYLFRQGDGTWDVSPPGTEHPLTSAL